MTVTKQRVTIHHNNRETQYKLDADGCVYEAVRIDVNGIRFEAGSAETAQQWYDRDLLELGIYGG